MSPSDKSPKDHRIRKTRKKLRKIGQDLVLLRHYLQDRVPHDYQREFQDQLQRAFDAGRAFSEVQNIPQSPPISDEGMISIGPELREHILEVRKVYSEVDQLRDLVANIFDEKAEAMLRKLLREQEERTTISDSVEMEL